MQQYHTEIDQALSAYKLDWQRMDDRVTCRIRVTRNDLSYLNEEQKDEIFSFLSDSAKTFITVFSKYAQKYKKRYAHHKWNKFL